MAIRPVKRKLFQVGDSTVVTLSNDMLEFINVKRGDDVIVMVDEKKKGRFIAVFKEE